MKAWLQLLVISGLGLLGLTGCASPPEASVERGDVLFSNYCAQCHGAAGSGNDRVGAPAIAHLPEWYTYEQLTKFRSGVRGAHYDDAEGLRMRPMALTLKNDDDVRAVAMYIETLAPQVQPAMTIAGDAAKGATSFTTCTACHGADAAGNQTLGAPPLLYQPDWYLVRQVGKFKHGVRGANPKDLKGMTMRPMAQTLADDQAINDVIAHVMSLRH